MWIVDKVKSFLNDGLGLSLSYEMGKYSNPNAKTLDREGYELNSSVFSAVNKITSAITQMRLYASDEDGNELENHPLNLLLQFPDESDGKRQGQSKWLAEYFSYYLTNGNAFIVKQSPDGGLNKGKPVRLKVFGHNVVTIRTKQTIIGEIVEGYFYNTRDRNEIVFEDIYHGKTFNPNSQAIGLSPILACGMSVDLDNEAKRWNVSLLQNGVNPSGLYKTKDSLSEAQFRRMRTQFDEDSGSGNAGKQKLLEGGLEFQQTGLSPKDADFSNGQALSKREIASVYNIAPQLIGDTASQTFANYEQATLSLHEDTAFPLLESFVNDLNAWIMPLYKTGVRISIDSSKVDALKNKQAKNLESVESSVSMTINEKREARGVEPVANGDVIVINGQTLESIIAGIPQAPVANTGKKSLDYKIKQSIALQTKEITKAEDRAIKESNRVIESFFESQSKEIQKAIKGAINEEDLTEKAWSVISKSTDELKEVYDEIYKDIAFEEVANSRSILKNLGLSAYETKENDPASLFTLSDKFKAEFSSMVDNYFVKIKVGELIKEVTAETMAMVQRTVIKGTKAGIGVQAIADEIQTLYKGSMKGYRSLRIARTETLRATSYAQHEAQLKTNPLVSQRWIHTHDSRTRPAKDSKSNFNHRTVGLVNGDIPLGEPFMVSDEKMDFPRDTSHGASAGNTIQCRCAVVYISEDYKDL